MFQPACDKQGFAALIGVLVFGAAAIAFSSVLIFSSLRSAQASLAMRHYYEAKNIARACADTALRSIHDNVTYTGTGSVTLGTGSCTYTVANNGGSIRQIDVSATVSRVTKRLQIFTSALVPIITLTSWREV